MKSIKFILSILGLILPLSVNAYDAKINGVFYNIVSGRAEVTDGDSSYVGSITIPKTITYEGVEYSVTDIGKYAFSNCKDLTDVSLPESILRIQDYAFYNSGIISVNLPKNLESIARYAFSTCENLASITFPYSLFGIDEYAFANCFSLKTVIVHSKKLRKNWFDSMKYVEAIIIGDELEEIEKDRYYGPFTAKTIAIDPNNKKYDSRDNCNAIIETATNKLVIGCNNTVIPESVTIIGYEAFHGCQEMSTIDIPESITSIEDYAFQNCTGLTSITIPKGVTRIEEGVFYGCENLNTIAFPDDITYISSGAFPYCPWYNSQPDGLIYVGKSVFRKGDLGENSEIVIKEGTKRILQNTFYYQKIKSIQLPESLESIGGGAFNSCDIEYITIPKNIKRIGSGAFSRSSLLEITLPGSLIEIGDNAFNGCENLTSATIENGISTIVDNMFSDCTSLRSVSIPNSVTIIDNSAFGSCESLDSITIPNSVDSIGNSAFISCKGLKSIVFSSVQNPSNTSISIGSSAFWGCKNLTSITLPIHVTSIGARAFGNCDSLKTVTILGDITSFDYGVFHNCSNIREFTYMSPTPCWVSNSYYYGYYFIPSDVFENAILYVPMQFIDTYKKTYPWYNFKHIVGLSDITMKLTCMAENTDVSSGVSIKWYNSKGEEIGNGPTIGCYKGQQLYYSISLSEDLGRQYHEVVNEWVYVTGDSTFICQLQKIENVELFGRVSAEDIAEKTATVYVKQMLNGKYEEIFTTSTNNKGEFSLEGYDDDTEIIISCDGYMDAVIHRKTLSGNGNFGVITLKPISGIVLPVNINYTLAESEDDNVTGDLMPGGLYDLQLALTNEYTGHEITDFSVQYNGTIIIKSGANSWEDISITAKSKAGVFAETSTTFHIDDDVTNSIDLNFIELGGISSTFSGSNNSNNVGYLYNDNGFLVARGVYMGETLKLRHLPEGSYTLVSIGQSSLLSNIPELSKLSELNLVAGKDYLASQVEVEDGKMTTISTGTIPRLNESIFLFDGSLMANKSSVVIGNYVTLSARVNIEEELYNKVNDVYLTFDLPEGCQLVANSVMANRSEQTYTLNGNTLSVHLPKDQALGEIRYCVIPVEANSYRSTAYVSFDKEITSPRPLGVALFEGEELTFRVPSTTANTRVILSGITNPNSEVKVYDGDIQIGITTANGDGSWTAECELYNAYNLSYHDILVKAKTQEGLTLTSSVKNVLYDLACIVPSSVSMTFFNGWHQDNITVDFDLINGTTSAKHYDFYTESDFTFLARFTNNDPELVDDVNFMVKASDGTIRILPALFDSKQQAWVATSKYDSNKLPQNVTVDYICTREESDDEREESLNELVRQMAATDNHINNFIDENTEIELIEDEEDHAVMECYFKGMDTPLNYRIELLYYEEVEQMMNEKQFFYIMDEEGDMGYYTEILEDSVIVTAVDLAEQVAFRMTLYDPYAFTNAKGHRISGMRKANNMWLKEWLTDKGNYLKNDFRKWKKGGGLGSLFFDILGVLGYMEAPKDIRIMASKLDQYGELFKKAEDKTMELITAKCPEGNYRLSSNQRDRFFKRASELNIQWDLFQKVYRDYLDMYAYAFLTNYISSASFSILCLPAKFGAKKIPGLMKNMADNKIIKDVAATQVAKSIMKAGKMMTKHNITPTEKGNTVRSMLGTMSKMAIYGLGAEVSGILSKGDFVAVRDELRSWSSKQSRWIIDYHVSLNKEIKSQYGACKKYDPVTHEVTDPWQENFVERKDDNTTSFTTPPVEPILDPSGFVYEAVLSNRLPGVTTTVYQKKNGNAVKWNAEDYSQENPLVTDEAGFYRWDVPQGEWQVKYEKDGYETCYSEWLPVPPPQLDVNVGMKQTTPPSVKQMRGVESGITIEMSKYMLPESMNDNNIVVKMDGATLNGHLEMLNTEESPTGDDTFVSKVKFVPEDPFHAGDEVYVTVKGSVESYCAVQMGADHTEKVVIQPEITAIVIDSVLTVPYEGTKTVQVLVMPQEVSAGKTLNARLSSSLITSLDNEMITIDENGLATLTLNGDLPGSALLTLTMDNTDVSAESKVKVDVEYEVASTPTSSIRNGEQVAAGTMLSLTCETEGASIYYTLDGSCPCNEATRIRYTGPIALTEGVVTVKAIAVAEYLYDSDVATFIYQVNSQTTGINTVATENHDFKASYMNGTIVIEGAEGANCRIYDLAGRELSGKDSLNGYDAISVSMADTYVVFLKFADGKAAVRKILRQ